MISTRSVELVIDTVVCLTLAKWETVSGQFGGYLRWLEWSTNFLAGRWCSTRSSLNFEICGAVPKYRFKIFWSVPTYRLDWVVLSYSRCRPLAPPMSADGCQRRPHPCYVPPLAQSTMSFGCSLGAEPQPC